VVRTSGPTWPQAQYHAQFFNLSSETIVRKALAYSLESKVVHLQHISPRPARKSENQRGGHKHDL